MLGYLRGAGIEVEANPDLYVRTYRQFGIDDALELRARASSRGIGGRRVFVVVAAAMTSEAQNALLKTLEEPPADALIVLVVQSPETLLSTVRSRSIGITVLPIGGGIPRESIDPASFFAATIPKRLDMLKIVLAKDEDDKYETGLIIAFLRSLEIYGAGRKDAPAKRQLLDAVYQARSYLADRGALVKTLLESVALLSPRL